MATQLLAKFESTPSYTLRKTQVKKCMQCIQYKPTDLFYFIVVVLQSSL